MSGNQQLYKFLRSHFAGARLKDNLYVQFNCPRCNHKDFGFSLKRLRGHCFRAECGWNPDLKQFLDLTGLFLDGPMPLPEEVKKDEPVNVQLPADAAPVAYRSEGKIIKVAPYTISKLAERGVMLDDCIKFDIRSTAFRVIIPVYYEDKLVSYVDRAAWWFDGIEPKYDYPKGAKVHHHFLGWEESRRWERLTLVENSFNAIWLRDHIFANTIFGSSLSDIQVEKILRSNVKSVAVIFDEDADQKAEKAVKKLKLMGVPAAYAKINKEPEVYDLDSLKVIARGTHRVAETRGLYSSWRK